MDNVTPKYHRILLKISGEALAGEKKTGLDFKMIASVCDAIQECRDLGVLVGVVIGGGNFWRGAKDGGGYMERSRADHMGMLATVMNCLAVSDVMEQKNIPVRVQTATEMRAFAETYTRQRAVKHLEEGKVVLFAGGTGCPYFSTDTAAVLRACEIDADAILLAKNIDGVYDCDPAIHPEAKRYDTLSIDDVVAQGLQVVDMTASILAKENRIPLRVFALQEKDSIIRAVTGNFNGTTVTA